MADDTLPVQSAIVAALKGNSGVSALVGARVYDLAPQNAVMPYVSIGPVIGEPFEAQLIDGWLQLVQIDTWSDKPGGVECRQIMAAIYAALHDAALTVTGRALVKIKLQSQRDIRDVNDAVRHGVQQFEIITHI